MTRRQVLRIALAKRDLTAKAVMKDIGVSPVWFYRVINGDGRSPRIEKEISERFPEVAEACPWPEAKR